MTNLNLLIISMAAVLFVCLTMWYHLLSCLILLELGVLLCVWSALYMDGLTSHLILIVLVLGVIESCYGLSLLVYSGRFATSGQENSNSSFF
nr:NADH dehydrogenase subunit 4l [Ficopomatus enigmaticus]